MYPTIRFRFPALLCIAVVLAACAKQEAIGAAPSSPTATLRAFYEAGKKRDSATLTTLVSKSWLEQVQGTGLSVESLLLSATDQMPDTMPRTRNERIEGNAATLEMHNPARDDWETYDFVKEDGAWKIAFKPVLDD